MIFNVNSGRFHFNDKRKLKGFILRASFTDRSGVKHYARDYGKRAFVIPIYG